MAMSYNGEFFQEKKLHAFWVFAKLSKHHNVFVDVNENLVKDKEETNRVFLTFVLIVIVVHKFKCK